MAHILITGCKGGIGLDAAKRLAKNGHHLYITVHKSESINETKDAFDPKADNVEIFKLDILNEKDRELVKDLPINVLINNAAIGDSGPLADIKIDRIKNTFDTNIFATLELTQLVIKNMLQKGKGKILFIGSLSGLIPMPFLAPYNMTKFTLEGMVFALRDELTPLGIDVIMISPGSYHTGFNQKNMMKKYDWMDLSHYSNEYLELIKKEERMLELTEIKNTSSIAKQIKKAVEAKNPRKRYFAPIYQRVGVPIVKLFR